MSNGPIGDKIPKVDLTDPGELEALYGPFGFFDYFRKSCLANCKEIVRATAAMDKKPMTESRIDDLAHTHPLYFGFLTDGLNGRRQREENARETLRGGA